jgi:hypothetical protein
MMSMDRELLQQYLDQLASRFYGYEIVERLEDAGFITVEQLIIALEEFIIEGRSVLDE